MRPEIDYVYNKLKRLRFDFNSSDFKGFRSEYRYEPTLDRYVRKDDNDLFIAKDTFKPLEEELEYADKCHNLEEQLGCPLEVRCAVVPDSFIYTFGTSMESQDVVTQRHIVTISKEGFTILYATATGKERKMELSWKAYKKTWWLKEDKSE